MVVFSQAVQRVGLIGLAIGQPNKASEALIKAAASLGEDKKEDKKVVYGCRASVSLICTFVRFEKVCFWSVLVTCHCLNYC